jgi:hypothetical protein
LQGLGVFFLHIFRKFAVSDLRGFSERRLQFFSIIFCWVSMKFSPWLVGISDAVGFVVGAQCGLWLGAWLGFDAFEPGYTNSALIGILLLGIGGGLGLQLSSRWRQKRAQRALNNDK